MKAICHGCRAVAACACMSIASLAAAQDPSATTQNQSGGGPMIVERVQSGVVVAPDFKVTRVDSRSSDLAGVDIGWLTDKTVFIGGGVYGLTNGNRDRQLGYGGMVLGWLAHADRPVGVGLKVLLGGGESTLTDTVTVPVLSPQPFPGFGRPPIPPPTPPTQTTVAVRVNDGFFVAEPEANLIVHLARNARLMVGVGYRAIASSENNTRLRGATGSVALQIGGGF
jgi:opacity protein-like surface antigen